MTMYNRVKPIVATAAVLLAITSGTAFAAEGQLPAGDPAGVVRPIFVKTGDPAPVIAPAPGAAQTDKITVEGILEYQDLEGGFYSVGGYALRGDAGVMASVKGQQVIVTGTEFTGVSIQMTKTLDVELILRPLTSARALPASVQVAGKAANSDVAPFVQDGVLMLPLRAVVEAAGGTVTWDAETMTVGVELSDRNANITIGKGEAEMNKRGVFYIRQNLLKMEKAAVLKDGRTFISADAVSNILGLAEKVEAGNGLSLQAME
jgi:hypothetical protein